VRRLLALLLLLALPAAAHAAAPPATLVPGTLTVGLDLPSPGFQVGAVQGSKVTFARGYEVDLAHALATRLGLRRVVFVNQARFDRLLAGGSKPWDVALAQITITAARRQQIDLSEAYLTVDQGVLLRHDLGARPRTLAALRRLKLCSQINTTSADALRDLVRPAVTLRLYGNVTLLLQDLQTRNCDAVVFDAPTLAVLRSQTPTRYGPFAGVLHTSERYGVALPRGSLLTAPVDAAIRALRLNGVLDALGRRWLTTDVADLPTLG
jgi:polar amino acid transport system substrate-binding protein